MPVSNLPIFPQAPQLWLTELLNANTTSLVTMITGGVNGTKVEGMMATSNSAVDLSIQIYANNSTLQGNVMIGSIYVPANAGNIANPPIPAIDLFKGGQIPGLPVDSSGNKYLYLPSGFTLSVNANNTIVSGHFVTVTAVGANF
jgi:hypothetical protein